MLDNDQGLFSRACRTLDKSHDEEEIEVGESVAKNMVLTNGKFY